MSERIASTQYGTKTKQPNREHHKEYQSYNKYNFYDIYKGHSPLYVKVIPQTLQT